MNKIEELVGRRIAYLRKLSGITQESLAEKANISRDFLSRVERGTSGISLSNLNGIAKAMNFPIKEFFKFEKINDKDQLIERLLALLRTQEKIVIKKWYKALHLLLKK